MTRRAQIATRLDFKFRRSGNHLKGRIMIRNFKEFYSHTERLRDQIAIAQKNMATEQRQQFRKEKRRISYLLLLSGGDELRAAIESLAGIALPNLAIHLLKSRDYSEIKQAGCLLQTMRPAPDTWSDGARKEWAEWTQWMKG
jgi:hypothetical protein